MMTPTQSLETIAKLLERAIDVEASPALVRILVASAHTHAIIQAVRVAYPQGFEAIPDPVKPPVFARSGATRQARKATA